MIGIGMEYGHMAMTFAVICGAVVLFAIDRIPLELSCGLTVLALLLLFHIFPLPVEAGSTTLNVTKLLAGFANPVVFTILSLLIVGQALIQTGSIEKFTEIVGGLIKIAPAATLGATLIIAACLSAFLNNTPVVIIFLPILTALAARLGKTAAHVLMPLSFITILGGMTTLVGSSANLIAAAVAETAGAVRIGFFDFAVPGLLLASVGALYVLFVIPRLIRPSPALRRATGERGKQFIAQIALGEAHPWNGMRAKSGMFPELKMMTVRLIQRQGRAILPPFEALELQPGDVVMIAATRRVLMAAIARDRDLIGDADDTSDPASDRDRLIMTEAIIAPGSPRIGGTVNPERFKADTACTLLGVERHSRMMRAPLNEIRLVAGDVLLLLGTPDAVRSLRDHRDLLLLARSRAELPVPHHAKSAIAIFVIMVFAAASSLVPIAIAAMGGAIAMILIGALTLPQAARAFDRKIFLLIGTAFAMAVSLEATGGARFMAHGVVEIFAEWGPAALLSALFLLIAILTNFLSNHATGALFAPIVVSAANEMGVDPAPFVYGLIFALNCSFATPIAYQTNLIVMGPGHYRFRDFMIAGTPLILIIWVVYSLFAPWYFDMAWVAPN
ncbi:MAG: SLC13 family permease [Proteobacteria bacterium]|nr:SLC13 family permease [Pseudomonadota bacterium]